MTPEAINFAVTRLRYDTLTISQYGRETSFNQVDLYDFVLFDSELGQELADLCIKHVNPNNDSEFSYAWNEFWDRAAHAFVTTNEDIKGYYEGLELDELMRKKGC